MKRKVVLLILGISLCLSACWNDPVKSQQESSPVLIVSDIPCDVDLDTVYME